MAEIQRSPARKEILEISPSRIIQTLAAATGISNLQPRVDISRSTSTSVMDLGLRLVVAGKCIKIIKYTIK